VKRFKAVQRSTSKISSGVRGVLEKRGEKEEKKRKKLLIHIMDRFEFVLYGNL
jgi:hypothetical protein